MNLVPIRINNIHNISLYVEKIKLLSPENQKRKVPSHAYHIIISIWDHLILKEKAIRDGKNSHKLLLIPVRKWYCRSWGNGWTNLLPKVGSRSMHCQIDYTVQTCSKFKYNRWEEKSENIEVSACLWQSTHFYAVFFTFLLNTSPPTPLNLTIKTRK